MLPDRLKKNLLRIDDSDLGLFRARWIAQSCTRWWLLIVCLFLPYAKQVGDVGPINLNSIVLHTVCLLYSLGTDHKENVCRGLYSLVLDVDGSATAKLTNWQPVACLYIGAPLTKEVIWSPVLSVGYFFMSTKINFKTFCERQSNLEASSFLEAALPSGQLRLLCITGD